jgi:squalene-hopene/tetraprenyl-beta-curcumene cyclase
MDANELAATGDYSGAAGTGTQSADLGFSARVPSLSPSPGADRLNESMRVAMQRTCQWLWQRQHGDGHWCAELEGDTILESEYVLLLAWLGQSSCPRARQAARYIEQQQNESGGWSLFPGGPLDTSVSVKAYFALKLTGTPAEAPHMRRAREAIRAAGGADRVNSFTRFYLALLGQIPFHLCPAVPPELILLPDWFPINIYRLSSWSRTIVVPLSIVWALAPVRQLDVQQGGIAELFLQPPEKWPPLRSPGSRPARHPFTWETFFRGTDRLLKRCERLRLRPFRRLAIGRAESWILERFEESDGLGAIFPPIIWSIIALKALNYSDDDPALRECHQQLEALILDDSPNSSSTLHGTDAPGLPAIRLQPCKSPVWDTTLALRALLTARCIRGEAIRDEPTGDGAVQEASAEEDTSRIQRAVAWLLEREVRTVGDWHRRAPVEPGGWYFEYRNRFYPDVDDSIMAMMALGAARKGCPFPSEPGARSEADGRMTESGDSILPSSSSIDQARDRAARWVLALQNRDGGWGAFDRDNDAEFLCHVPFADHNAMIDPSTPDITARVLEALADWGMAPEDPAVVRAITYVRRTQEADGSWYGRWGVNHIYGTWQVLVGLAAMGISPRDPAMQRGAQWLLGCQQASGGWGESPLSYADPAWRGRGTATASQTAWALLGLLAADCHDREAIRRGVQFLLTMQREDGGWDEPEFTGTGFPQVFYLRYHMYPIYFPLLALAQAASSLEH